MAEENKPQEQNLQSTQSDDTLQEDNPQAAGKAPEDTAGSAGDIGKLLAAKDEMINALMEQAESLNKQMAQLIRSSGTEAKNAQNTAYENSVIETGKGEDYVFLKDLGAEIGKKGKPKVDRA